MAIYRRKRDGALYRCSLAVTRRPGFDHWGDCYLLHPVWEGRTHYKSVEQFHQEFVKEQE